MKQIGIWMDKKEAYVVSVSQGETTMHTVPSELEFFNPKGGSRSKTRWGPQQVVHDSRYTERETHQLHTYYDRLADELRDADAIVLFGPAGTNSDFKKRLDAEYPAIGARVRDVRTADSMTSNQVKALVREYFQN
ncbi:MAG: hypothetical protein WBN56_03285 [Robiginitalea sp.]|uniref:hypothetical protein n=1 Tax=Robiginitalea sp. TaxID=1902411 RepID=UPI003C70F0C1